MRRVPDIRLLLVDRDGMMREGLAALFSREPGIDVIGNSDEGSEALELIGQLRPDVVIVNISPALVGGMEIVRSIVQQSVETKIIALSTLCHKALVAETFKAGAHAYVVTRNGFNELLRAVETVLSGATHVCSLTRKVVIDQYRDSIMDEAAPVLTDREYVVLQLIGEGRTSKEIARHMELSSKTIDACRRHLMRKLGVDSVAGLVKHAIIMGLTATSP